MHLKISLICGLGLNFIWRIEQDDEIGIELPEYLFIELLQRLLK